jgi:hypothetical protein
MFDLKGDGISGISCTTVDVDVESSAYGNQKNIDRLAKHLPSSTLHMESILPTLCHSTLVIPRLKYG